MQEFHLKLGPGGRIVIPAKCRKALDIQQGDDLVLEISDHEATFFSLRHALKRAQKEVRRYVKVGDSLTTDLFKLRKEDLSNE